MLLLAVDTSGRQGSIALAQCGPDDACTLVEMTTLSGGTFSAELVPQIAALLERNGFSKSDIEGLAVVSGPGSFTGLRIGLAVIKAFAETLAKPIAAVSLLEALASASRSQGRVVAAIDAGRNQLFVGEYELGAEPRLIHERLVTREAWLDSAGKELIVTPDRAIAEAAQAKGLRVIQVERPRSDAIARIGWTKIVSGETVSAEALEASYVGRSESELFLKGN